MSLLVISCGGYHKLYDVNVSGLFPENNVSETIFYYSIVEDEERDFVYKKNAAETNIGSNGVYVDGKLITAKDVKTHLIAGFESGAKNILNNSTFAAQNRQVCLDIIGQTCKPMLQLTFDEMFKFFRCFFQSLFKNLNQLL